MAEQKNDPIAAADTPAGKDVMSVEECAQVLISTVKDLRSENGLSEGEVTLYLIDAPLIHSTLSEYREEIMEKASLVAIVQVNEEAGVPMPEAIPQVEKQIGDDIVTVGIQEQAKG